MYSELADGFLPSYNRRLRSEFRNSLEAFGSNFLATLNTAVFFKLAAINSAINLRLIKNGRF